MNEKFSKKKIEIKDVLRFCVRLILDNLLITRPLVSNLKSQTETKKYTEPPTFQGFSFFYVVLFLQKLISGLTNVHFPRLPG